MKKLLFAMTLTLVLSGCYGPFKEELATDLRDWRRDRPDITEARQVNTNFYIGRELEGGEVLGTTDELYLDAEPLFTLYAQVPEDDARLPQRLTFELRNPENVVMTTEHRTYAPQHVTGITFDAQKLAAQGGQGPWTANFFADGYPLGRLDFGIYENPEIAEELKAQLAEEAGEVQPTDYIVK